MSRFSSLKYNPAETRRLLRDRFRRYLNTHFEPVRPQERTLILDDESLLALFLNLTIHFKSSIKRARAIYNHHRPTKSSEPRLNELIQTGWIRVVWGRIFVSLEIARVVRETHAKSMTGFVSLLEKRFDQTYTLTDLTAGNAEIASIFEKLKRKTIKLSDIGCQDPAWVAARLWDRILPTPVSSTTGLRVWIDRWIQLDCPTLLPDSVWSATAAHTFRDAAFAALESEPGLVNWEGTRSTLLQQYSLANGQSQSEIEDWIPVVPTTLVDRALWLEIPSLERPATEMLLQHEEFSGLVRILLADVEAAHHAPAPDKTAKRLIDAAAGRPFLLYVLLRHVQWKPMLLADLVLYPETSALACLLVAQWQSPSSAWDRELIRRDDRAVKLLAFTDAASVMDWHFSQGALDPSEAASLLAWFHGHARGGFNDDPDIRDSMLSTLRGVLAGQSEEVLRGMVTTLTSSRANFGPGSANFSAALDIVDVGGMAHDIEPTEFANGYVQSLTAGHHSLSADRISPSRAATLFILADRTSTNLRERFLYPISTKDAFSAGRSKFEREHTIARSLRTHIRVLSRAVSGWAKTMPDDLVQALTDAVRAGALRHEEKGRVAAFSPSFEAGTFSEPLEPPIAVDIAAALNALDDAHTEKFLTAVLETDEPTILAQLLLDSPHSVRGKITQRITELTPSRAGSIYSLTHAQARVEALLSAGLGESAEWFMDAECELETWGKGPNPSREIERLRATLRLKLMREEWETINTTEVPSQLPKAARQLAEETIDFFKAVATLKNPEGDREAAERLFARLQERHPHVSTYVQNLFAARLTLLLDGNFSVLSGSALTRGGQLLAEVQEMMLRAGPSERSVEKSYYCNRALLLLAIGRPEQAQEELGSLHQTDLNGAVGAYRSVALARLERGPEAMALLDQTELMIGTNDLLRAAREHVKSGEPLIIKTSISAADDAVSRVKAVLFEFQQMDPSQQAEVLIPGSDSFSMFVTNHVRGAAASVTSLVPMMKGVVIDSVEDDLSSLIRELLTLSLQFLGWSVLDQSRGGYTAKGNPGERDLLLKKGSTTLAVIEAVVCKNSIPVQKLTSHFQRLLAYSECDLFFYVTYAYVKNASRVEDQLRKIARDEAPESFRFDHFDDIPHTDSRPIGFAAHYKTERGAVKMVFLVLDMVQCAQRAAADATVEEHSQALG